MDSSADAAQELCPVLRYLGIGNRLGLTILCAILCLPFLLFNPFCKDLFPHFLCRYTQDEGSSGRTMALSILTFLISPILKPLWVQVISEMYYETFNI